MTTTGRPVTVLVIDDELAIRRALRHGLEPAHIIEASTGREGIDLVASARPDLVILDLGLPDTTGIDVCRELRQWSHTPILVLSARQADGEKVALLDAGADDYLTKPFSTAELQARARALLRRGAITEAKGDPCIVIGALSLDLTARVFSRDGERIHLTPIEWELLRVLMIHAGRTMTHQHLFREVWAGRQFGDAQQYLRVYIAHLRRKIEADPLRPRYIVTEPGVGYRFAGPGELS
ncbi:MAG TPA: response regulator [Gemmatimonadales bacterium]